MFIRLLRLVHNIFAKRTEAFNDTLTFFLVEINGPNVLFISSILLYTNATVLYLLM